MKKVSRRGLLTAMATVSGGLAAWPLVRRLSRPDSASVFVAKNQRYDGPLQRTILDGLSAIGLSSQGWRGKTVLLKPNLVEPARDMPHMTTHPAVVVAAAEVFRSWGATVKVGEGPGHVRDTESALLESNMLQALDAARLSFCDLNYSETRWVNNQTKSSKLAGFYFPREVHEADLIVSMPKMKTHHWVGYTGALKNLYGTLPGCKYGWPKNVLHLAGIPETVFDINGTLTKTIAIVDGILAMEGDGPIMGSAKPMGLLVMGRNCTAVDATLGRIMGFDPSRISYLQLAAVRLGPVDELGIEQRGEPWRDVASRFQVLDHPYHRSLLSSGQAPL